MFFKRESEELSNKEDVYLPVVLPWLLLFFFFKEKSKITDPLVF